MSGKRFSPESDPAIVGRRIANNFLARPFFFQTGARADTILYPEVCAWYGALQLAQLIGDEALKRQLIAKFDEFMLPEGARRLSSRAHVDFRITGAVPLQVYL